MLNLNELETKLDIALKNETSESLSDWLNKKRLNLSQLEQKFDEILDSFDSDKLRAWLTFAEQRAKDECEQDVNDMMESK